MDTVVCNTPGCYDVAEHVTSSGTHAFCDKHENPEWVVVGYNTEEPKHGLPLFRICNFKRLDVKDLQDGIAADQAERYPHIIYTVVKSADLWW